MDAAYIDARCAGCVCESEECRYCLKTMQKKAKRKRKLSSSYIRELTAQKPDNAKQS